MRIAVLLLSSLLTASVALAQEARIRLVDWTVAVPKGWVQQPPSSNMRLAQFIAPAKAGETQVAVFYFGPGGGGPVEANIERWASQFTTPNGKPVKPAVKKAKAGGMPVTHVELNGSYSRNVGVGQQGPGVVPEQSLRVAVVETPKGNITFQIWGHKNAVGANWPAFLGMVEGIKPVS